VKNKRGKTTETERPSREDYFNIHTMTVKRNESGDEGAGQIKNQSRHGIIRIYSM